MLEKIFAENDVRANVNRAAFENNGIRALDLMSSPGSGKTTVLGAALDEHADQFAIGVIEGDITTDLDAANGRHPGVAAEQPAWLLRRMPPRRTYGQPRPSWCARRSSTSVSAKAMVSSVTEGKDKPLMYPATFRSRDVVLLDKIDLVPFLDADVDAYIAHVREVNAAATILPTSTRTGAGMGSWS